MWRRLADIFLARRCDRANPRPRPGALLAASWTLLEKGSKSLARERASRPGPLSLRRISTWLLLQLTDKSMDLSRAAEAYLQALSTRLKRICSTERRLA